MDAPPLSEPPDEPPADSSIGRVALVGTSVAGTSLALAWKAARPGLVVTGLDAPAALEAAEEAGAVDRKAASPEAATDGADLVVLAGRLPAALHRLEELAPHLTPGTLVTDTGAVKQPIARQAADVLPEEVSFIGGHPIAPPDQAGATDADAAHFEGGTYFLCPPGGDAPEAVPDLDDLRTHHPNFLALAEATGARLQVLPAARHDRLCATARDLPACLTAALTELISAEGDHQALYALTQPSLRPLIWGREAPTGERREALVGNEGAVLDALGRYVRALQQTRRRLAAGDTEAALGTPSQDHT